MIQSSLSRPNILPASLGPLFSALIIFTALTLSACTSQAPKPSQNLSEAKETQSPAVEVESRDFDKDTLYALLVAEIAGQRSRLDIALGNYLEQAHITRDPGLAKRAMDIAQYIGARQAALDAATLWAEVDYDNHIALQASALELAQAGRLHEATRDMKRVLELDGASNFDLIALRATKLNTDERSDLLDTIEQTLLEYPQNIQLRLAKALLLDQQELFAPALKLTAEVLQGAPTNLRAQLLEGRLLHKMQRNDEALAKLSKALADQPKSRRLRLLYARILVQEGKLDTALEQFQFLQKQHPNDEDLLLSLSLIAMEIQLYNEAEVYLTRLLTSPSKRNTAHYYLGRLAEINGDWEKARDLYLRVSLGPDLLPAYLQLTKLLVDREQLEEAQAHLEAARKQFPNQRIQLYMLESDALSELHKYTEALQVLDDALYNYPRNTSLLYTHAMLAERVGDLAVMERDLRRVISIDPQNAMAYNALGYTLADRSERYEEALVLIEHAMSLNPNDPAIIDSLGWIKFRLGHTQEALTLLQQAYALFPDHEVAAHIVEALWTLGRKEEALALWNEAIQERPNSQLLKSVMERLKLSP